MAKRAKRGVLEEPVASFDDVQVFDETPYATRSHAIDLAAGQRIDLEVLLIASSTQDLADALRTGERLREITTHPNLGSVLRTFVAGTGQVNLVSEATEGTIFDTPGFASSPLGLRISFAIMIGGALVTLHEANVVHGDLRPTVFRMSRYGQPVLTGFGYTMQRGCRNLPDPSVTAYTAPELLSGGERTRVSDLYAFAAFCVHLLSGSPLYDVVGSGGTAGLAMKILSEDPPNLRHAGVPEALIAPLSTALSKDPTARDVNLRDLVLALSDFEGTLGTQTTRVPLPGLIIIEAPETPPASPPPPPAKLAPELDLSEGSSGSDEPLRDLTPRGPLVVPPPPRAVAVHRPAVAIGSGKAAAEVVLDGVEIPEPSSVETDTLVVLPPPSLDDLAPIPVRSCPNGHGVPDGVRFCATCGLTVVVGDGGLIPSISCPAGHPNRPGTQFCSACGTQIGGVPPTSAPHDAGRNLGMPAETRSETVAPNSAVTCPNGHANALGAAFCRSCGATIVATPTTPAPRTPLPPPAPSPPPTNSVCVNGHQQIGTPIACGICGAPMRGSGPSTTPTKLTATCVRGHIMAVTDAECPQCKMAHAPAEEGVVVIFREDS